MYLSKNTNWTNLQQAQNKIKFLKIHSKGVAHDAFKDFDDAKTSTAIALTPQKPLHQCKIKKQIVIIIDGQLCIFKQKEGWICGKLFTQNTNCCKATRAKGNKSSERPQLLSKVLLLLCTTLDEIVSAAQRAERLSEPEKRASETKI